MYVALPATPTVAVHRQVSHAAAAATGKPTPKPAPSGKESPDKKAQPSRKAPARKNITVTVKPGDSPYSIALAHHSTVAAIRKANPASAMVRFLPGTKLQVPVPVRQKVAASKTTSQSKPKPATPKGTPKPATPTASKPATPHLAPKPAVPKPAAPAPAAGKPAPSPDVAPKPSRIITYAGTSAAKGFPSSLVNAGDAHRAQLAKQTLPGRVTVRSMIETTAKRYGVDPNLAMAIGWQESTWQQSAVSVCDAVGVMQVMPSTATWAAQLGKLKLDRMQTQDNITAGVLTLRYLTEHARNRDEVIGAYYQGLGAMRAHGPYVDTRRYIQSVHHHMTNLPNLPHS